MKLATRVRTALVSAYDKTGILDFAKGLQSLGIELISTGGTAKLLAQNGVEVHEVSAYTGFPEILDGRVKTLHPKIHAGLLYRRDNASDRKTVDQLGIKPIDMVIVSLYPFEKATAGSYDLTNALENIDIGGPTMIRAAAKNFRNVIVVTDANDYTTILSELKTGNGQIPDGTRLELALKAFERTAAYDAAISFFFRTVATKAGVRKEWPAPQNLVLSFHKLQDLRYGENPHQKAAVYQDAQAENCIASARMAAGQKELSYTNILDLDAAYALIRELGGTTATIIIKHTNPCGIGKAETLAESCRRALETDPISAFGGIYAFTQPLDIETANLLADKFVELIVAPGFEPEALKVVSTKKNRRVLDVSGIMRADMKVEKSEKNFRRIRGGMLYQDSDDLLLDAGKMKVVTKRVPTSTEQDALSFGWKIVKHVKSNAIVLCSNEQLLGVGAGQMSRVDSCKIALKKAEEAGLNVRGASMASDAFLPFRDSIDLMGKAGITAVIQPGGSMRDGEVVQAADELGIAMQFTGIRHFMH